MIITSYTRSKDSLTVYDDNGNYDTLRPSDYELPKILNALTTLTLTGEPVELDITKYEIIKAVQLVAPEATVVSNAEGLSIRYDDLDLTIKNVSRLERHLRDAFYDPRRTNALRAFLANCAMAKRAHSVDELLDFVAKNDLPITDDGMILGWKYIVRNPKKGKGGPLNDATYTDAHSRTINNSLGLIVNMKAEDVDPNRHNDCSHGLHVCSRSYISHFPNETVLLVKIHPAHFIAVPTDYNHAKARTCAYLILDDKIFQSNPHNVSQYLDFPASVDLDGKTLAVASNVTAKHASLVALMRSLNQTAPLSDNTPSDATEPHAPANQQNRTWYSFEELADFTGKTKATIRGAASNLKWAKRLSPSGLIETLPDQAFYDKHIDGWFTLDQLITKFDQSRQKIIAAAKRHAWPQRRTNDGDLMLKPGADHLPASKNTSHDAPAKTAKKPLATTQKWYTFPDLAGITGKTTNAIRGAASHRHWKKRINKNGLTEVVPDKTFIDKHLTE